MPDYISQSRLKLFGQCEKAWYYRYLGGIPSPDNFYTRRGSLAHSVMEAACNDYENAIGAALDHIATLDEDPAMMEFLTGIAEHYVPYIFNDLGFVPLAGMVEYPIEVELDGYTFHGYADAVGMLGGEMVVIDWKFRNGIKNMLDDYIVGFDLQLPLYVKALQDEGYLVTGAYMVQLNTEYPKPPAITKKGKLSKSGTPTTRNLMIESLKALNPDPSAVAIGFDEMSHKVRDMEPYFVRPSKVGTSHTAQMLNTYRSYAARMAAIENAESFPVGVYNSRTCKWCDYKGFCLE